MKSFLLLALLSVMAVSTSNGQTPFEPPSVITHNALLIANHDSSYAISFTDTSIFAGQAKTFMLGHQWFNAVSGVNKRLYMNSYNVNEYDLTPAKKYADLDTLRLHPLPIPSYSFPFERYPRTTGKPLYINYTDGSWAFATLSLQLDPEAPSTGLDELFTPTDGDSLGAIFGFREKRGGNRGVADMSNHYIYTSDSVPTGDTGVVILSEPIGGEAMHRLASWLAPEVSRNGTRWYVAINLRRSDAIWDDSTDNTNDTILTVKLPYNFREKITISYDSAGFTKFKDTIVLSNKHIRFDSVSAFKVDSSLDTAYFPRGRWMDTKLISVDSTDTIFAIRRSMLPKFNDSCDITLSAFYRTTVKDTANKPFREESISKLGEIDTSVWRCDITVNAI